MIEERAGKSFCLSLAPASFVITGASSVNTDIQPLNGDMGIEIVLRPEDVTAYNAAMAQSFKKPLAVVADGQVVYLVTPEPNLAQYQSFGDALIIYGPSTEIQRIAGELRPDH